jgi:uncharacterized membrane protein
MVFAANAVNTSPNSFDAFVALAKQLNGSSSTNGTANGQPNSATLTNSQSIVALIAACVGLISVL